jgi:hypothetical protein
MRVWKLVSGILSIILFVIVMFQSCAAGLANTISNNKELSGSAGIIVSIMMLSGGIVSIATRNSKGKGANIALIVLFGIGALTGLTQNPTIFKDLLVWGGWCAINAALALVSLIKGNKSDITPTQQ